MRIPAQADAGWRGGAGPGQPVAAAPARLVFTIRPGVTFWGGHLVSSADVICGLGRDMNVKLGGFYVVIFDRVRWIVATGPRQVTITLTQPDYWLPDQMASIGASSSRGASPRSRGQNYGTPAGGIMCTGACTRLSACRRAAAGVAAQAARRSRNRARLDVLDTQVGFGDEPVAVEPRGEPAPVDA